MTDASDRPVGPVPTAGPSWVLCCTPDNSLRIDPENCLRDNAGALFILSDDFSLVATDVAGMPEIFRPVAVQPPPRESDG